MGLWRLDRDGKPQRFIPSEYVFRDMDRDDACAILGRLLDMLWETGKLTDSQVIEIIGFSGLTTQPASPVSTNGGE